MWRDGGWRVAHAWSSVRGGVFGVAERRVESPADLVEDEAAALGGLLRRLGAALGARLHAAR